MQQSDPQPQHHRLGFVPGGDFPLLLLLVPACALCRVGVRTSSRSWARLELPPPLASTRRGAVAQRQVCGRQI
ncbi:MAG: hypothetical protein ACK5JG_09530, partial [Pseudomonadota bacterium]